MEVAERVHDSLDGPCDLAMIFGSFHHAAAFTEASDTVRSTLSPAALLGTTAEAVLGDEQELDGRSGLTVLGLRLPGVTLHTWESTPEHPIRLNDAPQIAERIGLTEDHRATIMLADPFTTPMRRLLPAMTNCHGEDNPVPIVGGLASGAGQPGRNVLVLNDDARSSGAVGVTISGNIDIDFVVSQGCKPIGRPLVITKAKDNVILELGGRRAIDVGQEIASDLSEDDKRLLSGGLLIGFLIDEHKQHFGRGDFLVQNILGVDQRVGGIVSGAKVRVGRTIQLHVRDAQTASDDLDLLLDAQTMGEPPFGALLFSCNGRGARLFGEPGHDLDLLHKRFDDIPVAGFFAAGEIGPVGGKSFVHGHTASMALFRERGV